MIWFARRLLAAAAACAAAAVWVAAVGAAPASYNGGTYTQDFNGLPNAGTFTLTGAGPLDLAAAPVSATGLDGWQMARTDGTPAAFKVDDGTSGGTTPTGAIYSYGAASDADRALGSLASGTGGIHRFGAVFINNTGQDLNRFTVTFDLEQWRKGNSGVNTIPFAYALGGSDINTGTYTAVAALDLASPVTAGTDVALNGNLAANRTAKTATVTPGGGVKWTAGQTLVVRWSDANESGSDDGLAVDNLTFSATRVADLTWNTGGGTWDTNAANAVWVDAGAPAAYTDGALVTFPTPSPAADRTIAVQAAGVSPGAVTVNHAANTYTFTGGPVNGAALAKTGAGTLVLAAANGFSSASLGGGTVETQVGGALGAGTVALGGGVTWRSTTVAQAHANPLNITGAVTFDVQTDLTFSNNAAAGTGGGAVTKNGPGTLTVGGAFGANQTGNWSVNAGTLRAGAGGDWISGTTTVTVAAGATLDDSSGDGETLGLVVGAGRVIARHTNHLEIASGGNGTFSGTITAGTGGAVGATAAARNLTNGFRKNGAGTWTLTGTQSDFAGQVRVLQGALEIGNVAARGTASAVGLGTVNDTNLADFLIGSGTNAAALRYTGATATTDRGVAFASTGAGTGTIDVATAGTVLTIGGAVTGPAAPDGSFLKAGAGTLVLTAANTYAGTTAVNAGTLRVNGSTGAGVVTVAAAGRLEGTGTVGGPVTIAGTAAPGASVGTLAVGATTVAAGGKLSIEIAGPTSDLLQVNGDLNLSAANDTLEFVGAPNGTTTYTLVTYAGALAGTFDNVTVPAGYTLNYGTGNNSAITLTVPEPGGLTAAGVAAAAGLLARRRRRPRRP